MLTRSIDIYDMFEFRKINQINTHIILSRWKDILRHSLPVGAVQTPTVLIYGKNDAVVTQSSSLRLQKLFPHAIILSVDAGHVDTISVLERDQYRLLRRYLLQ